MSALAIDKYLGKAKNRIYRMGVELEGGWATVPSGVELGHDGSVAMDTNVMRTVPGIRVGELPSEILEISKFPTWVRQFYPSHVNNSCGMHVHMSFVSARHYQMLMERDFQDTIIKGLHNWAIAKNLPSTHPLWARLRGDNQYCKNEFFADAQASKPKSYSRSDGSHRYTIVNYPWTDYNTLEVRVLPMFKGADEAVEAIQQVLDITNASLVCLRRKEQKLHIAVTQPENAPGRETFESAIQPERITFSEETIV